MYEDHSEQFPIRTRNTANFDPIICTASCSDGEGLLVGLLPIEDTDRVTRSKVVPRNTSKGGILLPRPHSVIGATAWLACGDHFECSAT